MPQLSNRLDWFSFLLKQFSNFNGRLKFPRAVGGNLTHSLEVFANVNSKIPNRTEQHRGVLAGWIGERKAASFVRYRKKKELAIHAHTKIHTLIAAAFSASKSPASIRLLISSMITSLPLPLTKTTYLNPGYAASYSSLSLANRRASSSFPLGCACSAWL